MGCGVSVRKSSRSRIHASEPLLSASSQLIPGGREQARSHQDVSVTAALRQAIVQLQLEDFLPELYRLGVKDLESITSLLVSDLEGIGLTRVQVRQLQRAALGETGSARVCDASLDSKQSGEYADEVVSHKVEKLESSSNSNAHNGSSIHSASIESKVGQAKDSTSAQTNLQRDLGSFGIGDRGDDIAATEDTEQGHDAIETAREQTTDSRGFSSPPRCTEQADTTISFEVTWSPEQITNLEDLPNFEMTCLPSDFGGRYEESKQPQVNASTTHGADPHPKVALRRPPRPPCTPPRPKECVNVVATSEEVPILENQLPAHLRQRLEQRAGLRAARKQAAADDATDTDSALKAAPPGKSPTIDKRSASHDPEAGRQRLSPLPRNNTRSHSVGTSRCVADAEEKCSRQMFDKNCLRMMHHDVFKKAIERHRKDVLRIDEGRTTDDEPDLGNCTLRLCQAPIRVFIRKRPLSQKEEESEYDVVSVLVGQPLSTQVVLHSCLFQPDLKTPFLNNISFQFNHVFDQHAHNDHVYRIVAAELVRSTLAGGTNTILMFGQTGSGKTHTMTAIEGMVARDIFQSVGKGGAHVFARCIELKGNHCFDLLATRAQDRDKELRLREGADGTYVAEAAMDCAANSADQLLSTLRLAHGRRATCATDANATSSRSHAICTIQLQSRGRLVLVDCAGTEWRKDSAQHSRERQQESAEINASLHALKECVRCLREKKSVPSHVYRGSSLTKLLAEAFIKTSGGTLAAICTISPCASDTEHTLSTLRTAHALSGQCLEQSSKEIVTDMIEERPRRTHPKQWTPEQVRAWLSELDGGNFQDVLGALPSNFSGQMLVRVTEARCIQMCGNSQQRGHLLYEMLHEEMRCAEADRRQA